MDDAKIDQIAREVLKSLKKAHAQEAHPAPSRPVPAVEGALDPAYRLLAVAGGVVGGSPCVIEPGKVCCGSLKCRTFGH